jgi:hypothetical protein
MEKLVLKQFTSLFGLRERLIALKEKAMKEETYHGGGVLDCVVHYNKTHNCRVWMYSLEVNNDMIHVIKSLMRDPGDYLIYVDEKICLCHTASNGSETKEEIELYEIVQETPST